MVQETDEEFMKRMELKMKTEREMLILKIDKADEEISSLRNKIEALSQQMSIYKDTNNEKV